MGALQTRGETAVQKRSEWQLPAVSRPLTTDEAKGLPAQCGLSLILKGMQMAYLHLGALRAAEVHRAVQSMTWGVMAHNRLRRPSRG